jgi:hypothetical protein
VDATNVTKPETTNDVFHFPETLWVSRKKKAVAATNAMEIIQKDIPTKSSDLKITDSEANKD